MRHRGADLANSDHNLSCRCYHSGGNLVEDRNQAVVVVKFQTRSSELRLLQFDQSRSLCVLGHRRGLSAGAPIIADIIMRLLIDARFPLLLDHITGMGPSLFSNGSVRIIHEDYAE
jgi:hypothetical protein